MTNGWSHGSATSPPPSSLPAMGGDLRERLVRVEMAAHYSEQVISQHGATLSSLDDRMGRLFSRLSHVEQQTATDREQAAKLTARMDPLPGQITAMTARHDLIIAAAKWAGGALILIAVSAGKLSPELAERVIGLIIKGG